MVSQEIIEFIKKVKNEGHTDDEIRNALTQNGWPISDIEEGLARVAMPLSQPVPTVSVPTEAETTQQSVPPTENQVPMAMVIGSAVLILGIAVAGFFLMHKKTQTSLETVNNQPVSTTTTTNNSLPVVSNTNSSTTTTTDTVVKTPTPTPTNTPTTSVVPVQLIDCSDMQCLITAASTCHNSNYVISATVQNPFFQELTQFSKMKYSIQSSNDKKSCVFSITVLDSSFSVSDANRVKLRNKGMSDADIDSQIKTMNDSFLAVVNKPETCVSDTATISSYLTDMKNHPESIQSETSVNLEIATTTNTTSTGKKLICTQ